MSKQEAKRMIEGLLGDVEGLLTKVSEAQKPFLRSCKRVLDKLCVMRCAEPFMQPVAGVRGYTAVVRKPMCLSQIQLKLPGYATVQEFVVDLRLIVSNCFAFNGEDSALSAAARDMELAMEDLFVSDMGQPKPNPAEISARCRYLNETSQTRLMQIICLYEKMQTDSKAFQFTPDLLRIGTTRAVIEFLRKCSVPEKKKDQPPPSKDAAPPRVFKAVNRPPSRAAGTKRAIDVVDDDDEDLFHDVERDVQDTRVAEKPRAASTSMPKEPKPLQQNNHHVGFAEGVSPAHSDVSSNPFSDASDF